MGVIEICFEILLRVWCHSAPMTEGKCFPEPAPAIPVFQKCLGQLIWGLLWLIPSLAPPHLLKARVQPPHAHTPGVVLCKWADGQMQTELCFAAQLIPVYSSHAPRASRRDHGDACRHARP